MNAAPRPLDGLRVLDFGQYIAAPGAGQNLADLGADVIKIEPLAGDQARGIGPFGAAMVGANNRGKRSLAVDLRAPAGRQVVDDLLDTADVLLHNFRHGVSERLGLDPDTLTAAHPRLVYGFVTGFGTRGPSAYRVGLDIAAQAEFAVMDVTGAADGDPQRVGFTVADVLAAQALTSGVLAALVQRGVIGRGQVVETSLMEAVVHAQAATWAEYELTGAAPRRRGNGQALAAPAADLVRTRDGGALVVSAYTAEKFTVLCAAIGRPEAAADPRFASNPARVAHREELLGLLQDTLGRLDRSQALDVLRDAGIVCGAVRRFDEIVDDPDVRACGLIATCGDAGTAPTTPFSLDGRRPAHTPAAPAIGEHTRRVLAELGRDDQQIRALLDSGAVAQAADAPTPELTGPQEEAA